MSRLTQELSRYRKKNAFELLPELAQEVTVVQEPSFLCTEERGFVRLGVCATFVLRGYDAGLV